LEQKVEEFKHHAMKRHHFGSTIKGARAYPQNTKKGLSDSGPKKVISPQRFRAAFGSQNGAKSGTRKRPNTNLENMLSEVARAEHFCMSGALPCSENAIKPDFLNGCFYPCLGFMVAVLLLLPFNGLSKAVLGKWVLGTMNSVEGNL
jgi:hypothetical protein